MTLRLGDTAPDFKAETTAAPSSSTTGRPDLGRAVLAPGRLHAGVHHRARPVAALKEEFDKRKTKVDRPVGRLARAAPTGRGDIADVTGPLAQLPARSPTPTGKWPNLYDMIHPTPSQRSRCGRCSSSTRGQGPADAHVPGVAPAATSTSCSACIDSLQLTDRHKVATPADWKHGKRVIVAPPSATRKRPACSRAGSKQRNPISAWSPTRAHRARPLRRAAPTRASDQHRPCSGPRANPGGPDRPPAGSSKPWWRGPRSPSPARPHDPRPNDLGPQG